MPISENFLAHMASGATTIARAWLICRADGVTLGFTDHDGPLFFEGETFEASSGFAAGALAQSSGLASDNTEALGALSHEAVTEADIGAGRYDGAEVTCWQVNWADVSERRILFRGHIGEIKLSGGAFHAEFRGLSAQLNQPNGKVFQKQCPAVLGDTKCGVDLSAPEFRLEGALVSVDALGIHEVAGLETYTSGWFSQGRLTVINGAQAGRWAPIQRDRVIQNGRRGLELGLSHELSLEIGDMVRVEAGCDKSFATCIEKFANVANFRGFPDLPTDDWVYVHPSSHGALAGGSRR